jgi:hypothetical protein
VSRGSSDLIIRTFRCLAAIVFSLRDNPNVQFLGYLPDLRLILEFPEGISKLPDGSFKCYLLLFIALIQLIPDSPHINQAISFFLY